MQVYTDGSCRFQTGAWAWWNADTNDHDTGGEIPSTNQRMELQAALEALDHHLDDEELVIISDSAYLVNCINERWYEGWSRKSGDLWRNKRGKRIENADIWKPLLGLVEAHGTVSFEWVKGHAGDPGNERADKLAEEMVLLAMGDC
jgi:ribonuclease HI